MNNKVEIEDLIAATKRRRQDLARQQQLREMTERMYAAEQRRKRRRLWMAAGIAASVALIVTMGHGITTQQGDIVTGNTLVAKNNPPAIFPDWAATEADTPTAPAKAVPERHKHTKKVVNTMPADEEQDVEETLAIITLDEPAESPTPVDMVPTAAPETKTVPTTVEERRSTRMVRQASRPHGQASESRNTGMLAFSGSTGTSTTIEFGSWRIM